MGLLFHFNFKGETSQVESSELNHTAAVPASRRCVRGRSAPRRWVSPPVDENTVGVPWTPPHTCISRFGSQIHHGLAVPCPANRSASLWFINDLQMAPTQLPGASQPYLMSAVLRGDKRGTLLTEEFHRGPEGLLEASCLEICNFYSVFSPPGDCCAFFSVGVRGRRCRTNNARAPAWVTCDVMMLWGNVYGAGRAKGADQPVHLASCSV